MIVVKLIIGLIVVAIGLAVLWIWAAYKLIAWNPKVGIPIVGGAILIAGIAMLASG